MKANLQSNIVTNDETTLYIMCGLPGSGKSTWAKSFKEKLEKSGYKCVIVSRDDIRFSLIQNGNYFSKEKETFNSYCDTIQKYLDMGYQVIADATQIDSTSRAKLLNHLEIAEDVHVSCVYINTPIEKCKEYNSKRDGMRKVPEVVIERMNAKKMPPTLREYNGFNYDSIINVEG